MPNDSRTATLQAWVDRIDRFEQTAQTVAHFCAAEGVSPASFYQWRRKLGSESPSLARFVPVQLPAGSQEEPATVMSVEFPGGVRIRLEATGSKSVPS